MADEHHFMLRIRSGPPLCGATSVLTPELGEGAERPKAGKVEDFAYCAPLNFSWPRFR